MRCIYSTGRRMSMIVKYKYILSDSSIKGDLFTIQAGTAGEIRKRDCNCLGFLA